jgi:hypothetical protein
MPKPKPKKILYDYNKQFIDSQSWLRYIYNSLLYQEPKIAAADTDITPALIRELDET